MKKRLITIALTSTILVLSSCQSGPPKEAQGGDRKAAWEDFSIKMVNYWVGRKVELPSLPIFYRGSVTTDFSKVYTAPVKMVTYVDGECSVCASHLAHWKEFMADVQKDKLRCDFVFYINTLNINDFNNGVLKRMSFSYPWICDKKTEFIKRNDLRDMRFQTLLIDKENRVIMIGSIVDRPKLEQLFKQMIKEECKKYPAK